MNIEQTIINQLIHNEGFARKTIPHLKSSYFTASKWKALFTLIEKYYNQYSKLPNTTVLALELNNYNNNNTDRLSDEAIQTIKASLTEPEITTSSVQADSQKWLLEQTEKFCKDRALYGALLESIDIIENKPIQNAKKAISVGMIPDLLQKALSVSFDTSIGHDYLSDTQQRFDYYHEKKHKIPFDLDYFNEVTKGGIEKKTLNLVLAGVGIGKTLFMCHCAAAHLRLGYKVLYITFEMSPEKIAERIDANLLDVTIDELSVLSKDVFNKKIDRLKEKVLGKLIIKEYPAASVNVQHIRHLLLELKNKKDFTPDIIYVDYINLVGSSRFRSSDNSYGYIKAVAEELRGLAQEKDVPVFSATQVNRQGYNNSDFDLTNTAESWGLPQTADFMFALINTEQLAPLNQFLVKQLKSRYNDISRNKMFVIGIDRDHMRFYTVDQSAQNGIVDKAIFDKSRFMEDVSKTEKPEKRTLQRDLTRLQFD